MEVDRVAELHIRLVEETDDAHRARMHLELASLAVREGKLEFAARHFREALLFDGTLERARLGLHELGERTGPAERPGVFRSLWGRIRRR